MSADLAYAALTASRARTHALTAADDRHLVEQVDPLMSPLVWDLAHVGQQEELWLLRHLHGRPALLTAEVDGLYDAFRHPRAERPTLPLLDPARARAYLLDVRGRVEDGLAAGAAFEHGLVVQHEQQHVETMLATHQLRDAEPLVSASQPVPEPTGPVDPTPVLVDAGPCVVGVDGADEPWSLDNERPAHVVDVPAFRIGRHPVTNAQWEAFVEDGGYARRELWSADGWAHVRAADLKAPLFWTDGGVRRFGAVEPRRPDEPVQHVSFFEAEAHARWAGGRLPTEVEWEKACAWDPVAGARRRWPWGAEPWDRTRANLAREVGALRPAPVGAYPAGASAYGVEQTIGDVWEWTSSPLSPWPGFRPMVYDTYSQPFFGDGYRVLRGGSWAVGPDAVRPSFRNWDLPIRRQIFTGVRVAWDV